MRLIAAALVLSGCTLYAPADDDGVDGAVVPWPYPDAMRAPDAAPCDAFLGCPGAGANMVTVCGRLFDLESGQRVQARHAIRFHDALDFAGNPDGATVLMPEELRQDDCGRYVARNVPRPSLGFLAISLDDGDDLDELRKTVVAFPVTSGQVRSDQPVHALRRVTDAAWTEQSNVGGMTFADRGAILAVFTDGAGVRIEGVTITSNGSIRAADDFYFSDASVATRATVAPAQASTGVNGAALLLNSPLVEHTGTGGEPTGCTWPSELAASIPGVLFVQPFQAETPSGNPCVR